MATLVPTDASFKVSGDSLREGEEFLCFWLLQSWAFLGIILVLSQDTEDVANAGTENEATSSDTMDSKTAVL
jgi:hypothetical protein